MGSRIVAVAVVGIFALPLAAQRTAESTRDARQPDFVARIQKNATLAARIQPLLPLGTTLPRAAAGFENESRFLSALYVARDLNIPFDELKARLIANDSLSLGRAIHGLRPRVSESDANIAARAAEAEAQADLKSHSGAK
jgi:hypothetical protein